MFFVQKPGKFGTQVIHGLIGIGSIYGIVLSLTILGLALWSYRHGSDSVLEEALQLGVCVSVVWAFICLRGLNRSARELGAQIAPTFYTGPRPEDEDELRVWTWGRRFALAFILNVSCMVIFGLLIWLRNE